MHANFCDRCGCQLTDENTVWYGEGKYEVKLNARDLQKVINKKYAFGDPRREGVYQSGRYLGFCKDCQKIIDRVIENECFAYLPEKTVVDIKAMKDREG